MITYLGMGSNLGNSSELLRFGVSQFYGVAAVSPVYETEPIGGPEQNAYLNIVVKLDTLLSAHGLLQECHRIEQEAGRIRTVVNGPRTLDIDILLYGDQEINEQDLIIPHPRMDKRNFVIQPLLDLYPEYIPLGKPSGEVKMLGPL